MKSIGNKVLIKPDWGLKEEYDLGGVTITRQLNRIERRLDSNCVTGVVVAVPNKDKCVDDYGEEFDMDLKVGDYVYCHHFAFQDASYKKLDFIDDNGEEIYPVEYWNCFFVRELSGKYRMLNNFCLIDKVYKGSFESSFLVCAEAYSEPVKDRGVVRFACEKAKHLIGKEVLLKDAYSCYDIEIDGNKFYRVRYSSKYHGDIIAYDETIK